MIGNDDESHRNDTLSSFSAHLVKDTYSLQEFIAEYTQHCGRFLSPLTHTEFLELRIASIAGRLAVFKSASIVSQHTIPANWQLLLNFLYREGIIPSPEFNIRKHRNDLPKRFKAALRSRYNPQKTDSYDVSAVCVGYGMSHSQEEAYSKAVGELLERYFLSIYKKDSFVRASFNTLNRRGTLALNPTSLNGFLLWQQEKFPEYKYDADSILPWIHTSELLSGEEAYVPAQTIFWGYVREKELKEPQLLHPSTNGGAGHFTLAEATLSGIYEAVQRDGFLIYWLNTLSPAMFDTESISNVHLQKCVDDIRRYGLTVYFLDTTTNIGIPTCTCVLIDDRNDKPRISIGSGSGFDEASAFLSSAYEALSVLNNLSDDDHYELPDSFEPFVTGINRDERIRMWHGKEMFEKFRFFIEGKRVHFKESLFYQSAKDFSSHDSELAYVLGLFKRLGPGYEVYRHEVKDSVLARLGYHVVKIIIPQLIPLYLTERFATLDSMRLREVPEKLGYSATKLNPWPHPFP